MKLEEYAQDFNEMLLIFIEVPLKLPRYLLLYKIQNFNTGLAAHVWTPSPVGTMRFTRLE